MVEVKIKDKAFLYKLNLRAFFTYEDIAGKPYDGAKLFDSYVLAYAMLLANNVEFDLTFEEFINLCDEDPNIYNQSLAELKQYTDRASSIASDDKKKVNQYQ